MTQCPAYQSPYPHFSLEIVTTPHDDLSFQQEWFRNLAEKKPTRSGKGFFPAKPKPNPMNIRTLDRKITEL
ncbi:MAG TPA: hypothetical protein VEF35_02760, partial [Candidatus Bathyarchaeia archaeon]|nr:hypothetical protein [Candidatus Bathyarchaeia archaeon]